MSALEDLSEIRRISFDIGVPLSLVSVHLDVPADFVDRVTVHAREMSRSMEAKIRALRVALSEAEAAIDAAIIERRGKKYSHYVPERAFPALARLAVYAEMLQLKTTTMSSLLSGHRSSWFAWMRGSQRPSVHAVELIEAMTGAYAKLYRHIFGKTARKAKEIDRMCRDLETRLAGLGGRKREVRMLQNQIMTPPECAELKELLHQSAVSYVVANNWCELPKGQLERWVRGREAVPPEGMDLIEKLLIVLEDVVTLQKRLGLNYFNAEIDE